MFNSKQQLNQITFLVSNALRTNLSKTRHKIAQQAGHKSYESLYAALPDKEKSSKPVIQKNIEDFPKNYLSCRTEFEYPTLDRGEIAEIHVFTTKDIQLLFQGFMFRDPDWALNKLVVERIHLYYDNYENLDADSVSIMSATILPVNHIAHDGSKPVTQIKHGREHYYGTFAQHLKPSLVFNDKNMLLSNRDFCQDLILFGSINQYNFFCENPEITVKHELENELLVRYIAELTYSSTYEKSSMQSFGYDISIFDAFRKGVKRFTGDMHNPSSINHISHQSSLAIFTSLDTGVYIDEQVFEILRTPPIDLCDTDFFSYFMNALQEEPSKYFSKCLLPLDSDEHYGELDNSYDPEALFDKSYIPENVEVAILYHGNWVTQILCKNHNNSINITRSSDAGEMFDILGILAKNKIDVDNEAITEFLLNNLKDFSSLETNSFFFALRNKEDRPNDFELPIIACLAFDLCEPHLARFDNNQKQIQYLLSNLDERVLDQQFDLSIYLEPDMNDDDNLSGELINHKSARSMFIYTLKATSHTSGK